MRFYSVTFFIDALSKQKRMVRCAMRKPQNLPFKIFSAQLTELKNYLPLFPGSSNANTMPPEEINYILLHTIPNGW